VSRALQILMSHLRPHAKVLSLKQHNREILKNFDTDKKAGRVLTGIGAIYRALQLSVELG
jgi:hypothetical protein